jgi:hypothetical protein
MGTPGTNADAHAQDNLHNPEVHHEHSDINVRAILWFVIVLATTAAVVHVAMYGLFKVFDRMEAANDPSIPLGRPIAVAPPDPRLQTTPWQDLKAFRATEDQALHSYGWVGRNAGVVSLPIDRAKELLLERGLPTRSGAGDPTEGTHVASTGESNSGRMIPAGQPDASSGQGQDTSGGAGETATGGIAGQPGNAPAGQPTTAKKPGGGA